MPENIKDFLPLLADNDSFVANRTMALLLERPRALETVISRWQESDEALLRKRAQEMQCIILQRNMRREMTRLISGTRHFNYLEALILLHMQWYDRDVRSAVAAQLYEFAESFQQKYDCATLAGLSGGMQDFGMRAEGESTLCPDNYCIGMVLTDRHGATSLLVGLLYYLSGMARQFRMVRVEGEFALYDGREVLLPGRDWEVTAAPAVHRLTGWSLREFIELAGNQLFTASVSTRNVHYMATLGEVVTNCPAESVMKRFPYPFCSQDIEDKSKKSKNKNGKSGE